MADFLMPSLGADMTEATLVQWHIKVGDTVKRGQVIAEVDTAKGVIEIECFDSGIVTSLVAAEGETLPVGAVMAKIRSSEAESLKLPSEKTNQSAATKPLTPSPDSEKKSRATPALPSDSNLLKKAEEIGRRPKISPLARRRAQERGLDVSALVGSGPNGEITLADVDQWSKPSSPSTEKQKPASTSNERLRGAIAAAMAKSNREIPHYYLQTTIDMMRSDEWIKTENAKRPIAKRLLPVTISLKAMALALREVPQLNGYWEDGRQRIASDIHVGFAVTMSDGGLVTPAIHHVDRLSLDEIMSALKELIPRARTGRLRSSEMTDSTITLTNLGDLGVESVFGVIYPPQVALVGLGKTLQRPWVVDGTIVIRPLMIATLSADHRATDGQTGARFLEALNRLLQTPEKL